MGTHSHSYTTPAAQERPSTEEMADALDAGHGAAAIAAATRTYEEACADGHYDHAEYWCDVLRVLYRRYAEAAGGTTWDLTSPHAAVASIVATYGRDAAALLIQASIDETHSRASRRIAGSGQRRRSGWPMARTRTWGSGPAASECHRAARRRLKGRVFPSVLRILVGTALVRARATAGRYQSGGDDSRSTAANPSDGPPA